MPNEHHENRIDHDHLFKSLLQNFLRNSLSCSSLKFGKKLTLPI